MVGGDQIAYRSGADANDESFAELYRAFEQLAGGPDKDISAQAAEGLKEEAETGEQVLESAVRKWLSFLAETAPDARQVAVDTSINPAKGLSMVFQLPPRRTKSKRRRQTPR